MKKLIYLSLLLASTIGMAQWTETNLEFTSTGTSYTKIQLAEHSWGGSHGILFNAYKSASDGTLAKTGNTKYANDHGPYGGGAGAIMFVGNGGTMDFYVSPGSTAKDDGIDWGVPKMRIKRNGLVGIGTENPDAKLTVKGDIHAEEVLVDLSVPGPDYVFEEDYDLRTLEETEAYIRANKHLPEVPSAIEMEANGIELGEMNMLLLKKVEELTLHTIEQQKMLEKQQSLIEQQGKLIEELQLEIGKR